MDEKDQLYYTETIKRYQEFYNKYGNDIKSLGWKDENEMKKRFRALSDIGIMFENSVLDVGCGFGDFLSLYREQYNGPPHILIDYTGIDILADFLILAEKKWEWSKNVEFKCSTVFEIEKKYDWVVGSGIFNHKSCSYKYILRTLQKAFELCNKGIAFNFISTYVDYRNPELFYTNPHKIFDYSKILSKYVTLQHNYMPFEFTIYIYKRE